MNEYSRNKRLRGFGLPWRPYRTWSLCSAADCAHGHLPKEAVFLWLCLSELLATTGPTLVKHPAFFIPAPFMIRRVSFS